MGHLFGRRSWRRRSPCVALEDAQQLQGVALWIGHQQQLDFIATTTVF
jgi:hypothetical protein